MNRTVARSLASAGLILLAACNRGGSETGSAPSGQVVAKIGGDEITQRELTAELGGFTSQDENTTKQAQQAAINAIVNRKIFARAAKDAGMEKSPDYQLMRYRADELLLAQMYQRQLASKLPRPSQQQIAQYIAQHPNTFAERKIYTVDQIKIPRNTDRALLDRLKPLRSMDEIEQLLLSSGVEYVRSPTSLDARSAPPAVIDQIAKLPANEPFVVPAGNMVTINLVTQAKTVPFTGPAANELAERIIMNERATKATADRMAELRKTVGDIQYQPGYAPSGTAGQPKQP